MILKKELLEQILEENKIKTKDDLSSFMTKLSKEVIETLLEGELTDHLGYPKHRISGKNIDNSRNGFTSKELISNYGNFEIDVPRDRKSEFDPLVIKKREKDITGIEEKIISMYAKGMTTRDIQEHVTELYGIEMSAEKVSHITNTVLERAKEWQSRPLNSIYPIVFMDALVLKVRKDGIVKNTAIYGIIGINLEGFKECLGLWIGDSESSKFWLGVLNEIKNRGVKDVLIFSVDNLSGISEAIKVAFPLAEVQKCVVHQIRNSLTYVSWKDRKQAASDLKNIYGAATEEKALSELEDFKLKWDKKYPHISAGWERNWTELSTFFKYPDEIRRLIYTTNPIESFNYMLKKVSKNRCSFPNEESVFKLLYLATEGISKKWTMKIQNWGFIFAQISIYFEERLKKFI